MPGSINLEINETTDLVTSDFHIDNAMSRSGTENDWVEMKRDADTGIESVSAHFRGHAYDPHDHDEMLIGVTEQGVQRFRCRRSMHTSIPGRAILIEPGAVHDGHAPEDAGFTYSMLYLPLAWLDNTASHVEGAYSGAVYKTFSSTLVENALLVMHIRRAFRALHSNEGRLARDEALDTLIVQLSGRTQSGPVSQSAQITPAAARARDALHANMTRNIDLYELAALSGIDRFRLTRQFTCAYGFSPHAYLVRLRLRTARLLLAKGETPTQAALTVGFSDQSHLGRWFVRAYRLTPAAYRALCTNVLD